MLYHMGPGGLYNEDNFFRKNVVEYPDFNELKRPSSSLVKSNSTSKQLKTNQPFKCNAQLNLILMKPLS